MSKTKKLAYNKVCNVEDFAWLIDDLRGYLPLAADGDVHRKWWEFGQVLRAFRDFGVLRADATLLGVGAGTETTTFLLTNYVHSVHATDLYADPGMWHREANHMMLLDPARCVPSYVETWQPQRLVVQHMDMRALRYADESFDGVYSCSSIEHVGDLPEIRAALNEIARVLKPGGIAAIMTEFALDKLDEMWFWPGVKLMDRSSLAAVLPLSLRMVDELDDRVSEATLATTLIFDDALRYPSRRPHIVLQRQGKRFTSVSLILRKEDPDV